MHRCCSSLPLPLPLSLLLSLFFSFLLFLFLSYFRHFVTSSFVFHLSSFLFPFSFSGVLLASTSFFNPPPWVHPCWFLSSPSSSPFLFSFLFSFLLFLFLSLFFFFCLSFVFSSFVFLRSFQSFLFPFSFSVVLFPWPRLPSSIRLLDASVLVPLFPLPSSLFPLSLLQIISFYNIAGLEES